MDFLTANGINWIVSIQSLGGWLEMPMRFFTFLGSENFFFLVLPLIYWSLDAALGLRVAMILVTSNALNAIMKLAFASPRPFWVSDHIQPLTVETSFGVPSGHSQNAVAMWGIMADGSRKRWAWGFVVLLAFLIGLSRLYLGVHFVQDVIWGWLIGGILLWAFLRFWDAAAAWLHRQTLLQQILIAFVASVLVLFFGVWSVGRLHSFVFPEEWVVNALRAGEQPNPVSIEDFITIAGKLFGLGAGAAWITSRGGFDTSGPVEKRALRYVLGLIGILVLWMGLGQVFPRDENMISYILRYSRYILVGIWITAGAPWLFFHFKLARNPKMQVSRLL
jgi:membrane-associated phospholipid phosphatase